MSNLESEFDQMTLGSPESSTSDDQEEKAEDPSSEKGRSTCKEEKIDRRRDSDDEAPGCASVVSLQEATNDSDDGRTFEDSATESDCETGGEENCPSIAKDASVYKLDLDQLKVDTFDANTIFEALKNRLSKTEQITIEREEVFQPYQVIRIRYQNGGTAADKITNFISKLNDKEMTEVEELKKFMRKNKGNTFTGYITVFYRQDEIYFLCEGFSFRPILSLADRAFRTDCAKRFLRDDNISRLTVENVAEPNIRTSRVIKAGVDLAFNSISYFESVILVVHGVLESKSELGKLVYDKEKKIKLKIGVYHFKIGKQLQYEKWAQIFHLFSNQKAQIINPSSSKIAEVLANFQRVEDVDETSSELEKELNEKVIGLISDNKTLDQYYLSCKEFEAFHLAKSFALCGHKLATGEGHKTQLMQWDVMPSLREVVAAILENYTDKTKLKELLENDIVLKYQCRHLKGVTTRPILDLIHGTVKKGERVFHKISENWYVIASSLSETVELNFNRLTKALGEKMKGQCMLTYPWRQLGKGQEGKFTLRQIESHLKLSEEDAKRLMELLTKPIDGLKAHQLSDSSCVIPCSSGIVQFCTKKATTGGDETPYPQRFVQLEPDGKYLICKPEDGNFEVKNPIITTQMFNDFKRGASQSEIQEWEITNFLKSVMQLNEKEYNGLYLFGDTSHVIVGDGCLVNGIELFDILYHEESSKITYLFYIKKKLNRDTRAACAQIRDAASLLWRDYFRGNTYHAGVFYDQVESRTPRSPTEWFRRKNLIKIGKQTFLNYFDDESRLIFVLGYAVAGHEGSNSFTTDFSPIDPSHFNTELGALQNAGFVTKDGYLTDKMIPLTSQEKFLEKCKGAQLQTEIEDERLKQVYDILAKKGNLAHINQSMIAKLELLSLDDNFSPFQVGGSRKFELSLLQINTQ